MTHIGNLTQQAHHLTPARTMTAWAIVSKISQDMRAFVDKCRISIALSALLQVPLIRCQNGIPISGYRGANLQQRLIALLDTRRCQHPRSSPG